MVILGTTSKWCVLPKIWVNRLNVYLSCEMVFQKVHFGKSSSHTCTLKAGFDADVLCKLSYLFTQPWSRIYLSPTNPYGEAWSKPRMLAASHRAGWWGLSRLLLHVLWSLFSYWSMSSKAAPRLWLYGVKGPPFPGVWYNEGERTTHDLQLSQTRYLKQPGPETEQQHRFVPAHGPGPSGPADVLRVMCFTAR